MRLSNRHIPFLILSVFLSGALLAQSADLSVVKSGTAEATAGSAVTYDVVVTNNGPSDAVSVTLNDAIPAGMNFVSADQDSGPPFACSNPTFDTVTCTGALLPSGQIAEFTFVFEIDPGSFGTPDFTNVATVSATTPDPNSANNSDDAVTTMPLADLVVMKTGPATADAGDDVTYTVTIENDGPDEALSVELEDVIPDGMTFVSMIAPAGFSCSDPGAGNEGTILCTTASLADEETATFTFVFNIPGATPAGTSFGNVATVGSVSENPTLRVFDPNEENNSSTVVTTLAPPPPADLQVTKTAPSAAQKGSDVSYDITLVNLGPSAATNVTLEDELPEDMTFVSATQHTGPAMNCISLPNPGEEGTIICTLDSLPAGESITLTIVGHIPAQTNIGVYGNSVLVTSANDPNEDNNVSGVSTNVSEVDLSVLKEGPAAVTAGTNVSYTITVSNAGPDDAFFVTLTDELPAGTTFVSVSPVANCTVPGPGTHGTVVCTADVPAGSSIQYTLVIDADDATAITNTAVVSTTESFDVDESDNSSSVNTTITQQADLAVAKSGPASVTAGTDVGYTVTLTNNGPSTAANVSLTDAVPANTTFVGAVQNSGPPFICGEAAGTITCTRASLAAGATATFTFTIHVAPAATGSIENTANASSTIADPNGSNNSSNVVSTVAVIADLAVAKSGPATATAGTNVTYTVTATNNGPSTAANVTLTDFVPPGTTFVSSMQNSGPTFNCVAAAATITCTIASFAPAAPAVFTFVFAVPAGATGVVSNAVSLISSSPDFDGSNNAASSMAIIAASADLSVTKTGPADVNAGSNASYTITVNNAGPSTATNVSLTDVLPANATFVSMTQTGGPTFNCNPPAAGQVVCTIASLAPSAPATFTLVMTANSDATGALENSATVSSNTADPDLANNTDTTTAGIDAGPTDLSITKTANGTQFGPGAPVTYTITVTNNGPSVAFATTVTDVLPAGTTFVSATPSQGSCTGTTTVVCTLGTLAPSTSATIALVVTLPATQGEVSNTASVFAVNADSNAGNNASTSALAVVSTIPSLSEWGLLLFAMMLAVAGATAVRR